MSLKFHLGRTTSQLDERRQMTQNAATRLMAAIVRKTGLAIDDFTAYVKASDGSFRPIPDWRGFIRLVDGSTGEFYISCRIPHAPSTADEHPLLTRSSGVDDLGKMSGTAGEARTGSALGEDDLVDAVIVELKAKVDATYGRDVLGTRPRRGSVPAVDLAALAGLLSQATRE